MGEKMNKSVDILCICSNPKNCIVEIAELKALEAYTKIIEDKQSGLINRIGEHLDHVKELEQQIEQMITQIEKFIQKYECDDLTAALTYFLNKWSRTNNQNTPSDNHKGLYNQSYI